MRAFDPYHLWLGIPPKDQPPNHYRLLAIELFESDGDVIDAAANRQMVYLKQMSSGAESELSQRLLNEIAAARLCLLNPKAREEYDRELRGRAFPSPAPWHSRRVLIGAASLAAGVVAFGVYWFSRSDPALKPVIASQEVAAAPTVVVDDTTAAAEPDSTPDELTESLEFEDEGESVGDSRNSAFVARSVPPLTEPIDLLARIEPERDAYEGVWKKEGNALFSPATPYARLVLPADVPQQYQLTAVVRRLRGGEAQMLGFTLVAQGRRFLLMLDSRPGNKLVSGLTRLDGKRFVDNETARTGRVIRGPGPHRINIKVWTTGIEVHVDSTRIVNWRGDFERLTLGSRWITPQKDKLCLCTWKAQFVFDELRLEPLTEVQPQATR